MRRTPISARLLDKLMDVQEELFHEALPEKARSHFRSARREALLGLRALLDEAIEQTQETTDSKNAPENRGGSSKIAIDE
ncbi:hypothetical protein [Paenibacillus caseinilyticus]|uniref:hypothetical protein n=1 Tax=Paenibacillus caseinilyticus TaxID=3098138 RepID=UPI0022B87317|nr:hypothetical protein [Paenibacillus caseinilyticus]MCZ8519939.1 hypothetical protein [Paenibacillus caseinilyticus]